MGDDLGMACAPPFDALIQQFLLLRLVFRPPSWLGFRIREAAGQFATTEDGGEVGAAQCRFLECPLSGVVCGLGAVDTYDDRPSLLYSRIVAGP